MKTGYTVWPWMLKKDEKTGKLSTDPNVIRPAYELGVKEISFLGYDTIETFTPIVDAYEADPELFLSLHAENNLKFVCLYAHLSADFVEDMKLIVRCKNFMKINDIPYFNLQMPMRDLSKEVTDDQIKEIAEKSNKIGELLKEIGATLCVHQHLNTFIETVDQFEKFADYTNPDLVKFCLDTAHLYFGGFDYVKTFEKYFSRVAYVHLKDVSYIDVPDKFSMFRPLGQGRIDFPNIVRVLNENGYNGILCVELDRTRWGNFEGAMFSRNYLRSVFRL